MSPLHFDGEPDYAERMRRLFEPDEEGWLIRFLRRMKDIFGNVYTPRSR